MHWDFEKFLQRLTPKKGILALLDGILKEVFNEKNKRQCNLNECKKQRIKEIEKKIEVLSDTIWKITIPSLFQSTQEKRAELEQEKEILQNKLQAKALNEREFIVLYERIKNIIEDPLSIWELWSVELKMLLVGVLFWWKLYYKKNEGY